MTRLDLETKPNRPQFASDKPRRSHRSVEAMLHEMAYVLHLTEMVKAEIITESEAKDLRRKTTTAELCF